VSEEDHTAAPAALDVQNVVRQFGGVKAVAGATFQVPAGSITGLIGPNGAGKSTLMGVISGFIGPSSGHVGFFGTDVTGWAPYRVARQGLIRTFQLSSEFARMTVLENLLVAAPGNRGESVVGALLGKRYWWRDEADLIYAARELMARFGMAEKEEEYAGNLSGGQKRLVEIMRGLMARPKLLLLDEPLAGVNPTLSRRILDYLVALRDDGLTILMAEHDLAAVGRVCDPVVVMARGEILASGTLTELRARKDVRDAYFVG
jgi:ABC-type branched-subunit amino acid transport system ATPase component